MIPKTPNTDAAMICLTCNSVVAPHADDPFTADCPKCGLVEIDIGKMDGKPFEAYSRESYEAFEKQRKEPKPPRDLDPDDIPF